MKKVVLLLMVLSLILLTVISLVSPMFTARALEAEDVGSEETYDYVIITTNDIVRNSQTLPFFINLKELYGHNVKVVTETDFEGVIGQAPNGRAEKIRQWLKDHRIPLGIEYVLLIGDPDPDDESDPTDHIGDIPMKMCWPAFEAPSNYYNWWREHPTDLYYADLDGNWDLDGDCYYGEYLPINNPTKPELLSDGDYFSIRWTGEVETDYNQDYKFWIWSDSSIRLWVDGDLQIDNWTPHVAAWDTSPGKSLSIGKHAIKLEFCSATGDAMVKLYWSSNDQTGSVDYNWVLIPKEKLFHDQSSGGLKGDYYDEMDFTDLAGSGIDGPIEFAWVTGDRGPSGISSCAEIYVGRIPAYDGEYDQLDHILQKIIDYETEPGDISWRKKILLPTYPSCPGEPGWGLMEKIKADIADPNGFAAYRIFNASGETTPPPCEETPCNPDNVEREWKNGYGMVTWFAHGTSTDAEEVFSIGNCPNLDDTKPSFVFQASCLNAYPETRVNFGLDNLAYSLLKHGAVSTIGGTRTTTYSTPVGGWSSPDSDGCNQDFAYYYTKNIIQDQNTAGEALQRAKEYFDLNTARSTWSNCLAYNLYGDPECSLLTTVPNNPPTAEAGGPYEVNEGSRITYDASGSTDPDGDTLQYRWDLNNDGIWETNWSNDPTLSITWGDDYVGTVKVEVADGLASAEDTDCWTILNVAPAVTIDSMTQPNPHFILPIIHTLAFEGSFTDPGWFDTHKVEWSFGDGTVASGTLVEENTPPDATGVVTASHVYSNPGTYTVTLTVTDDDGAADTDTMQVAVMSAEQVNDDISQYIQNLADSAFKSNPTQREKALSNMFAAVTEKIENEQWNDAIKDLTNNIRSKADGFVDGNPRDDWITDPVAQQEICRMIDDLVAYLKTFL